MDQIDRLKSLLTERGYSITKPRLEVFRVLAANEEPLNVTDIVARLSTKVDKVSIYRTIELYEKIGIVHRVWTGFKSKVELSEAFSPHHHHFTCIKCGKTTGLRSEALEKELENLESDQHFKLTHHSIELKGFCEDCIRQVNITHEKGRVAHASGVQAT